MGSYISNRNAVGGPDVAVRACARYGVRRLADFCDMYARTRVHVAISLECLVELALPPAWFRSRSDDMQAFHRERGIQSRRGQGRNDGEQFYVRYCFADPSQSDAFCDPF